MIIHSPIISGSLTFADGATFTLPSNGTFSGTVNATNGVVSGSSQITGIGNAQLTNSSTTIGTTAISLGASATTIAGLTSVTSTGFTGALTGNASTATTAAALTTARTINGTSFDGSANITIPNLVSGSSQVTYTSVSSIPAGIVSGSSQITYANISSIPAGIVSGSSQLSGTTITDLTIVNLTTINETASVIFSSGSNRFGDFGNDTHSFTGSVQVSGSHTIVGGLTATSLGIGMAASATVGRIDATNDIVAYSSSDIRFKENITPIENALDKISKISGNTYDWKAENKAEHGYEGNDVGVIAQEIEAILPQLVQTRENGFKAVKYDKLVTLLIEGIKEQQKQIDDLTSKVNSLENKI